MHEVVTIGGASYPSYASLEDANDYLAANFLATAWQDLTDDDVKGRLLVTATRLLDRQCWQGEPTGLSGQLLAWPRKNIEDVDETVVPTGIVNGTIELALAILNGSDAVNSNVPGAQKIRDLRAGSVSLSYFRGAEGDLIEKARLPLPVQELVGKWLCGSKSIAGLVISGVDGVSVTDQDLGFNEGI